MMPMLLAPWRDQEAASREANDESRDGPDI
jgi:hypothetical protein